MIANLNFTANYQAVLNEIAQATSNAQRPTAAVRLLAVSKTKPVAAIQALLQLGHTAMGENYCDELLTKAEQLRDTAVEWHLIGHLQSNKVGKIANHIAWIHSLDRLRVAERLSRCRTPTSAPLNACIQVNISQEPSKNGVFIDQIAELAEQISQLPNINLRGLMAIPASQTSLAPAPWLEQYRTMAEIYHWLQSQYTGIDTLSLGMSDDLATAIDHGATLVRVGSAIFGART